MKISQLLKKVDMKTLLLGILLGLIICRNIWCGCCLKEDFREGMDHDGGEEEEEEEQEDGEPMGDMQGPVEGMDHDGEGMGHEENEGMGHEENEGMDHDGGVEEEEEENLALPNKLKTSLRACYLSFKAEKASLVLVPL